VAIEIPLGLATHVRAALDVSCSPNAAMLASEDKSTFLKVSLASGMVARISLITA
jgi:hypothetical protein